MIHPLFEIAVSVRGFIEPIWHEWHRASGGPPPKVAAASTCGRSSLFLVEVLHHAGLDAEWQSGTPRLSEAGPELGPYGFFTGRRWESHAWVRCGAHIIDITADQFGADRIIVTAADDARYRVGERDTALPAYVAARRAAVDAMWRRWLAHCAGANDAQTERCEPSR